MLALCEASSPRLSGALAPGRVGCGRATSSVCRRATSTRAPYDHVRTSDGVVKRCFARHCGLDASRPGAWRFTGDPRTPAVGTSLDASTQVPSMCTGSDRDRRESAREKAIHEHSTVAQGRWTMQCPSDGEPPRTAANLYLDASTCNQPMCTTSDRTMRGPARAMALHQGRSGGQRRRVSDKQRAHSRPPRYRVITPHACLVCMGV